jgi:hypothetical protein
VARFLAICDGFESGNGRRRKDCDEIRRKSSGQHGLTVFWEGKIATEVCIMNYLK